MPLCPGAMQDHMSNVSRVSGVFGEGIRMVSLRKRRIEPVRATAPQRAILCALALLAVAPGAFAGASASPTIAVNPSPLTPFTSGGCYQPRMYECYRVSGTADPGTTVVLAVADDSTPARSLQFVTRSAERSDPGAGIVAGDWALSPNVTDLGSHGLQASMLTFTATTDSGSASISVEKHAATAGDVYPPLLTTYKTPSGYWCHLTGPNCAQISIGQSGEQQVSGLIDDDTPGAYGLASEVADVIIRIRQRSNGYVREIHSFTRRGTQASYSAVLRINDFEPGTYDLSVVAFDAVGNASNEDSSTFTVLPI